VRCRDSIGGVLVAMRHFPAQAKTSVRRLPGSTYALNAHIQAPCAPCVTQVTTTHHLSCSPAGLGRHGNLGRGALAGGLHLQTVHHHHACTQHSLGSALRVVHATPLHLVRRQLQCTQLAKFTAITDTSNPRSLTAQSCLPLRKALFFRVILRFTARTAKVQLVPFLASVICVRRHSMLRTCERQ
jgi:hypothetical protein